jgi:hypothetical protein
MHQPPATSIPSQHQLRAELEAMVVGDLLGPAGGDAEELTERTVRDRYLVGVLAPSRRGGSSEAGDGNHPTHHSPPSTLHDSEEEDEEIPLIPDELSEGGSDTADDGNTDADIPVVQAHLPSSFGMSFCVDAEAKTIKASATWGQYKREKRDDQQDYKGNPLKVWKRYTRGGSITIPLKDGPIKAKAPDPEFPDIYIQGQVRKRNTHFIVTLFLVNAQEELRPKDEYHIFQPKLTASGEDGQAVFCKRTTLGNNNDLEERLMAMLYRHHVEFAVGHGVSVHAELAAGSPHKATSIETVIIPTYEVPRTAPPTEEDADDNPAFGKLAGLVLDMKVLAESDAKNRITLVSFAVYKIPNVGKALVRAAKRGVRLTVIVETPDKIEGEGEYSTIKALGQEVAACSTVYFWPKENRPVGDNNKVGILHVKCVVGDGEWLFLSSANLTQQAFTINMELGMLVRGGKMPKRVEQQFDRLIQSGQLKQV